MEHIEVGGKQFHLVDERGVRLSYEIVGGDYVVQTHVGVGANKKAALKSVESAAVPVTKVIPAVEPVSKPTAKIAVKPLVKPAAKVFPVRKKYGR